MAGGRGSLSSRTVAIDDADGSDVWAQQVMRTDYPIVQRVTVQIGDAIVTIMPRRAPVGNSGPIRGQSLAMFPDPPVQPGAVPVEFVERGEYLRPHLPDRRHDLFFGTADPGGRQVTAVANLDRFGAAAVGRALGLSEILFWDGRRAGVLECDAGPG